MNPNFYTKTIGQWIQSIHRNGKVILLTISIINSVFYQTD